jgi:hypothetical protein
LIDVFISSSVEEVVSVSDFDITLFNLLPCLTPPPHFLMAENEEEELGKVRG